MKLAVPLRDALRRLPRYQAPPEGRAGKLRLDFNENTVGCSPRVRAAITRMRSHQAAMYPEYEAPRRALARYFRVTPDELLLTNGADDALRLLTDAFLERGRHALIVEPTFPMYGFNVRLAGAGLKHLRYDSEMRFPLDAVCDALKLRPAVFFLPNPNNPTGTLVKLPELQTVLKAARKTVVVVDEAYWEFSGTTALGWIRRYPNLVVVRTFSKAAGLAGLRIGCLLANRTLTAALRRAQPPFPVNSAALAAAVAVTQDAASVRAYVREVKIARELLSTALARLGVRTFPSGGNFLLVDFGRQAAALLAGLQRNGILLRDGGTHWGRAGLVRITVGTRAQTQRLIRVLGRRFA